MRAIRILMFLVAIAFAAAAVGSLIQSAPPKAAQRRNPFYGDEHAQRAGAKLYARECASCHGDKREGRRNAPPLNRPDVQSAASGNLFWVLTNGSLHRGMPSFAHLPEAQRWQIVTFLRSGPNRADGR
jgi:mono/diheme cytochrome c family protein